MRAIRVVPGSKKEAAFLELLKKSECHMESVIRRDGISFTRPYDEYILSDGLCRVIAEDLNRLEEIEERIEISKKEIERKHDRFYNYRLRHGC